MKHGQPRIYVKVVYFAAKYSTGELKKSFLEKAEYFHLYVINKLNDFETKSLARPIALLMQNRWMHGYFCEYPKVSAPVISSKFDFSGNNEFWTKSKIIKKIATDLVCALKESSLEKEMHWMRCRKGKHV